MRMVISASIKSRCVPIPRASESASLRLWPKSTHSRRCSSPGMSERERWIFSTVSSVEPVSTMTQPERSGRTDSRQRSMTFDSFRTIITRVISGWLIERSAVV